MTVKPPPSAIQLPLLDVRPNKPISRNGEARTRYGACVNEAVNALLGLEDIPNSGSHDCVFDSYHRPSSTFVEVKSLRVKNKIPVYRWRIEKDKAAGVPLVYVIGIHDCKGAKSLDEMWRRMADTLDTVLVLPAARIEALALAEDLQTIGSHRTPSGERNGYQRKGYKEGYHNIPWAKLADGMQQGRTRTAEIHGLNFVANVFFHQTLTPWLD
jgi:hypothetical protein